MRGRRGNSQGARTTPIGAASRQQSLHRDFDLLDQGHGHHGPDDHLVLYPAEVAVYLPRLAGVAVHRRGSPIWVLRVVLTVLC
jgi:hypothetical protein